MSPEDSLNDTLIFAWVPLFLIPKDRYFEKTLSNMQEVIARGGKILFITDHKKELMNEKMSIYSSSVAYSLTCVCGV